MNPMSFERTFLSDMRVVKMITVKALDFIRDALPGVSFDDLMELKLIFSELLYNAVIHGNKQDRLLNVRFRIDITGSTVHTTVSDEGHGFDYVRLLTRGEAEREAALFDEYGRGLILVSALADDVAFNTSGNSVRFNKRVTLNGATSGRSDTGY